MNALKIMEHAVNQGGSDYQFSATYLKDLGYYTNKLNGTGSAAQCYWSIYIGNPDGGEERSKVGLTHLHIRNGYSLIMKYEQ